MAVDALPGSLALTDFRSNSDQPCSEDLSPEIRSIVEVIALTGHVWHDWLQVRQILRALLCQTLDEFERMRQASDGAEVGPTRPLPTGETYAEVKERLVKGLESFHDYPPFTIQRLCELLLNPGQHSNLHRLSFAYEKVLLVTSPAAPPSQAYPSLPLPAQRLDALYHLPKPQADSEVTESQRLSQLVETGEHGLEEDNPDHERVGEREGDGGEEGVPMEADMEGRGKESREGEGERHQEDGEGGRGEEEEEGDSRMLVEGGASLAGMDTGAETLVMSDGRGESTERGEEGERGEGLKRQKGETERTGGSLRLGEDVEPAPPTAAAEAGATAAGAAFSQLPPPAASTSFEEGAPEAMECLPEVGYAMGEPGPLPEDIVSTEMSIPRGPTEGQQQVQGTEDSSSSVAAGPDGAQDKGGKEKAACESIKSKGASQAEEEEREVDTYLVMDPSESSPVPGSTPEVAAAKGSGEGDGHTHKESGTVEGTKEAGAVGVSEGGVESQESTGIQP